MAIRHQLTDVIRNNKFINTIVKKIDLFRAENYVKNIFNFFNTEDNILDIGSGFSSISKKLIDMKFNVKSLDINNSSLYPDIKPVVYDGKNIPFKKNEFDASIFIVVLHHIKEQELVIREAMRVSKKIIITEEVYSNLLEKYLLFFYDSLVNLEFVGHPHTNRTEEQWNCLFKKLKLKIIKKERSRYLGLIKVVTYYLEK